MKCHYFFKSLKKSQPINILELFKVCRNTTSLLLCNIFSIQLHLKTDADRMPKPPKIHLDKAVGSNIGFKKSHHYSIILCYKP